MLWDEYLVNKQKVADAVKQKTITQKSKVIFRNAANATVNPRAYWNTLRRLNRKSEYPIKIRDPDHPDLVIDDPLLIKSKLTSYWATIGKGQNGKDMSKSMRIHELYSESPAPGSLSKIVIDSNLLDIALSKLKNNKACGVDSIPGEFLKYCDISAKSALLDLFKTIKLHELIPDEWYEGLVKPLHKEGSREVLSNYRGITISSVVYKTLVSIIESQTMGYIEKNDIYGEFQGAFRKGRRCEDNIFSLKGILAIRKSKKQKTYLAFLDISKAYDHLDRDTMFLHLWQKGIQGKAWRMIRMLYEKVDNKVIFGCYESDMYEVMNGLKQGCVISPTIFNLVMTDLHHMLTSCITDGVKIQDTTIHGLYFADDIVLFASCEEQLERMLEVAHGFGQKWGVSFSDKKSKVLVIGRRISNKKWKLGNKMLEETSSYKYLGVIINSRLKDNTHIKDHVLSKASTAESSIRYNLAIHSDINRIQFGNTLWKQAVLPSLTHAGGVWFCESKTNRDLLSSAQYKCAKSVLKIKSSPSSIATLLELGWLPINDELDVQRASYFQYLTKLDNSRLAKVIFHELYDLFVKGIDTNFCYFKNIKNLLERQGVDCWFQSGVQKSGYKRLTAENAFFESLQKTMVQSSLKHFDKVNPVCSSYLLTRTTYKAVQLKFKLRTGILEIGENMSRQQRGNGQCPSCGAYETVKHIILLCKEYQSERQLMFVRIKDSVDEPSFNMFIRSPEYAMMKLLGEHDDYFNKEFLSFLLCMWTKRQQL